MHAFASIDRKKQNIPSGIQFEKCSLWPIHTWLIFIALVANVKQISPIDFCFKYTIYSITIDFRKLKSYRVILCVWVRNNGI